MVGCLVAKSRCPSFGAENIAILRRSAIWLAAELGGGVDWSEAVNRRLGIEIKRRDVPRMSRSMGIAIEDLGLEELMVVYPGERSFELDRKIKAVSLQTAVSEVVTF